MAKPEWGSKRNCFSCGARFYDLRREPIVCPVCGTIHDPARQPRPKRPGPAIRDEPIIVPEVPDEDIAAAVGEEEILDDEAGEVEDNETTEEGNVEELSEEGEIIEDASELGEDDDDIGEVMEHVDDELEKP